MGISQPQVLLNQPLQSLTLFLHWWLAEKGIKHYTNTATLPASFIAEEGDAQGRGIHIQEVVVLLRRKYAISTISTALRHTTTSGSIAILFPQERRQKRMLPKVNMAERTTSCIHYEIHVAQQTHHEILHCYFRMVVRMEGFTFLLQKKYISTLQTLQIALNSAQPAFGLKMPCKPVAINTAYTFWRAFCLFPDILQCAYTRFFFCWLASIHWAKALQAYIWRF